MSMPKTAAQTLGVKIKTGSISKRQIAESINRIVQDHTRQHIHQQSVAARRLAWILGLDTRSQAIAGRLATATIKSHGEITEVLVQCPVWKESEEKIFDSVLEYLQTHAEVIRKPIMYSTRMTPMSDQSVIVISSQVRDLRTNDYNWMVDVIDELTVLEQVAYTLYRSRTPAPDEDKMGLSEFLASDRADAEIRHACSWWADRREWNWIRIMLNQPSPGEADRIMSLIQDRIENRPDPFILES